MKKIMLTALCLAMAMSVVSCDDSSSDKKDDKAYLVIVNAMSFGETAEGLLVSGASGAGSEIIGNSAEAWLSSVTMGPKKVFVTGSFNDTETGVEDDAEPVGLTAGLFEATYQSLADTDGDCSMSASGVATCTSGGTFYETEVSGVIHAQYTLESGKTYVIYFCGLADDLDDNADYVSVLEKGTTWLFNDMTVLSVESLDCDDADGGSCTGVDIVTP